MAEFNEFLKSHLERVRPLSRAVNLAYWQATTSGKQQDFERMADLQISLQRIYANQDDYRRLGEWLEGDHLDTLDRRQARLLHNAYRRNQIDPVLNERITKLSSTIENAFNVHRATLNGRIITRNEIVDILKDSLDSAERERAWMAGKEVGAVVEEDLLTLVGLRNQAAAALGFDNYYVMALELSEQNAEEIVAVFDELEELTREPFREMKADLDARLRARFGATVLRPWHYEDPFFQEAPQVYDTDLDGYYADQDIVALVSRHFEAIGLPVDDIVERSDLYERRGKDQHAFCTDIDREGDIRILANIKKNEAWTGTMLHELGHAVHDKYIDPQLPYLLRQEAHIFTTEAIAMMFGRLSKDGDWLEHMVGIDADQRKTVERGLEKNQRLSQLVFARWSQVMVRFERALYEDPVRDLNGLWWQLVERFQLVTPPDNVHFPHWASKNHLVSAPVYYHNYLLGEILASQLTHHIVEHVLPEHATDGSVSGHAEVGEYLKTHVFGPGSRYRWDEMIERATGEPLTPKYFVEQFVR